MEYNERQIFGNWDLGYTADKHIISSYIVGVNEYGHNIFDTTRTQVGESVFLLKYRHDQNQIVPLAELAVTIIGNHYPKFDFVVGAPPSQIRPYQPVDLISSKIAEILGIQYVNNFLLKQPLEAKLKDVAGKEKKLEVLRNKITVDNSVLNDGKWDVLVVDDLYDSGATLETICSSLRGSPKINRIYVIAMTRKGHD